MTRRNGFVVGAILLLTIVGLWLVGVMYNVNTASAKLATTPTPLTAQPAVTAKGSIVPARYARVSFSTSGTVSQSLVMEGDTVKAGDPLAQLDTGDFKLQLQGAQDALEIAQATLAQLKAAGTPGEITAAEANLRNAATQYDKIKNGPGGADLKILQATLAKSEAALQTAQAAYDRVGGSSNPSIGMMPQSLVLQQASQDYQIAKSNYDLKTQVDAAALAAAEAQTYNAQVALEFKKNGARPADLAVAEARVGQAKTALSQAQAALAKATLVAPFDGTVTGLILRQGEAIGAGAPAVIIADLSQWRVETSDLDEWGAARIRMGQPIKATVNAFAAKILTGKVINVASQSTTLSTGDISYVVTIALDQRDPEVRWGMTVKVEFLQ